MLNFLRKMERTSDDVSRDRLLRMLVSNSRVAALKGRTQAGYGYYVADAWQGRWSGPLRVIGDKKGHGTSGMLAASWVDGLRRLRALQQLVSLPFAIFHVMRNPFDIIATQCWRRHAGNEQWVALSRNGSASSVAPVHWRAEFDVVVDNFLAIERVNARLVAWLQQCAQARNNNNNNNNIGIVVDGESCIDGFIVHVDGRDLLRDPGSLSRRQSRITREVVNVVAQCSHCYRSRT